MLNLVPDWWEGEVSLSWKKEGAGEDGVLWVEVEI